MKSIIVDCGNRNRSMKEEFAIQDRKGTWKALDHIPVGPDYFSADGITMLILVFLLNLPRSLEFSEQDCLPVYSCGFTKGFHAL